MILLNILLKRFKKFLIEKTAILNLVYEKKRRIWKQNVRTITDSEYKIAVHSQFFKIFDSINIIIGGKGEVLKVSKRYIQDT